MLIFHRSSTEYLTPGRQATSAPPSPTLSPPRYPPTSARSNASRSSRRSKKMRSPRPFSPVYSNINYNDATERYWGYVSYQLRCKCRLLFLSIHVHVFFCPFPASWFLGKLCFVSCVRWTGFWRPCLKISSQLSCRQLAPVGSSSMLIVKNHYSLRKQPPHIGRLSRGLKAARCEAAVFAG